MIWVLVVLLLAVALLAQASGPGVSSAEAPDDRRRFVPPEVPVPLPAQARWIAIRGVTADQLLDQLPIEDRERCGWRDGLQDAGDPDTLFVADAGDEWVLLVSAGLPLPEHEGASPAFERLAQGLATSLRRELFFFAAESRRDLYVWAWLGPEEVVRVVRWERGVLVVNIGEVLPAEEAVGPRLSEAGPSAEIVAEIAARWCLDGRVLAGRGIRGLGWLARWREAVWD